MQFSRKNVGDGASFCNCRGTRYGEGFGFFKEYTTCQGIKKRSQNASNCWWWPNKPNFSFALMLEALHIGGRRDAFEFFEGGRERIAVVEPAKLGKAFGGKMRVIA